MRLLPALLVLAFVAGCAIGPVPVVPPGPVTPPAPVDPGPTPVTEGAITEALYASISTGMWQPDVRALLGKPFRTTDAGGYLIDVYAFAGSDSVAWFMFKGGALARKARL